MFPFKLKVNFKKLTFAWSISFIFEAPPFLGNNEGKYNAYSARCKSLFYFSFVVFLTTVVLDDFFNGKDALNGSL